MVAALQAVAGREAIDSVVNSLSHPNLTLPVWRFGHELRWQRGSGTHHPATPIRAFTTPKVRNLVVDCEN